MASTALTGIVGQTIFVKSFQTDAYGVQSKTPVVWSSSDVTKAIARSVINTNNAVIYCISSGTATITATMGSVTATFSLTVNTSSAPADGYTLVVESDQAFQSPNQTTK